GRGLACCAAFIGFTVELLRDAGRPACLTGPNNVDLVAVLAARQAQAVARLDRLGGFAGGAIDLDLAALDRLLGERARLVEACGPQPDGEADAGVVDGWRGFHGV